jgi:hypothetical protein
VNQSIVCGVEGGQSIKHQTIITLGELRARGICGAPAARTLLDWGRSPS